MLFALSTLTLHLPRANDALAEEDEQQQDHGGTLHLDVVDAKRTQMYITHAGRRENLCRFGRVTVRVQCAIFYFALDDTRVVFGVFGTTWSLRWTLILPARRIDRTIVIHYAEIGGG